MTIETIEEQAESGGLELRSDVVGATSRLQQFAQDADAAYRIALVLAPTSFVPNSYRKRGDQWLAAETVAQTAAAAMLAGDEVGLSPMQSLAAIDVIEGKPALNALAQRALVQAHGHEVWVHERSGGDRRGTFVTMRGRRKGSDHIEEVTWSWDRAVQADLSSKRNWTRHTEAMCLARASAEICRLIAADVLMGLAYAAEELTDGEGGAGDVVEVAVRPREGAHKTVHVPKIAEERHEQTREELAEQETPVEASGPEPTPQGPEEPATPASEQSAEEEEPFCGEPKAGEPTKVCSRPFGHDGRHHFGKTISAEEAAAREPAPEPIADPEGTEPELREGVQDPEFRRCPYYRADQQCELPSQHEGEHKAGELTWGGKRCVATHPELGQCRLDEGHDGDHEPELEEAQEEELFSQPSDADLEAALEADRAEQQPAAQEEAVDAEVVEDESESEADDPWADFK